MSGRKSGAPNEKISPKASESHVYVSFLLLFFFFFFLKICIVETDIYINLAESSFNDETIFSKKFSSNIIFKLFFEIFS